jgi:hypothetical protein
MSALEEEPQVPVRYFIHYPQIIHTTFRAAVYSIATNPARVFSSFGAIITPPLVLIFSQNTCIVKGNRDSTSHA